MVYLNEAKKIWLALIGDFPEVKMGPCLESKGYEPEQPAKALEVESEILVRLQTFGPDLILLKVDQGRVDVFELCKQIKADPLLRNVPLIIFGSENNMANAGKAYRAGAGYYVGLAGEDCSDLLDLVERTLAKRRRREAKDQS